MALDSCMLICARSWLLTHVCSYVLDHVMPEFEEPMEQAQVEEFTNLELDQGKP
jgi:hypothetical protein